MTQSSYNILPYRPCVGIALFNDDGHVFVGERIDTPGAWQMPQGGIDSGEEPEDAALREMREEIGTDNAEILKQCNESLCYDLPGHLMGRLWGGKYRGQEQIWIAARFLAQDEDIDLGAHYHPEFRNWQWVDLEALLDLIVPFKRDTYRHVIQDFKPIADRIARNEFPIYRRL